MVQDRPSRWRVVRTVVVKGDQDGYRQFDRQTGGRRIKQGRRTGRVLQP